MKDFFAIAIVVAFSVYALIVSDKIIEHRARIETLESQLVDARRAHDWISVLTQILSEMAKCELDLMAEELKQRKARECGTKND